MEKTLVTQCQTIIFYINFANSSAIPIFYAFFPVILDVSVMLHHTSNVCVFCIIVRCPEGMQANTAKDDCELCAVGTYSDSVTADNETCTMCPAEHTTSAAGSKNASDCFCKCQRPRTHYTQKYNKAVILHTHYSYLSQLQQFLNSFYKWLWATIFNTLS